MSALPAGEPLALDHASIAVPGLAEAVAWLESRVGLRATVSPGDPGRHSRVHFDRSYLEVSAREPANEWRFGPFFLRFNDPRSLKRHLDAAGIASRFDTYEGVDGRWDDVELVGREVPLPILVRRTHPPEIAANWPPPLGEPHRCGARTLEAVVLNVPDLALAVETYCRLLGLPREAATRDGGQATVPLASGQVILAEGERPGLAGVVLGVMSLAATARIVGPIAGRPIAWLDHAPAHGRRLGFVQATR